MVRGGPAFWIGIAANEHTLRRLPVRIDHFAGGHRDLRQRLPLQIREIDANAATGISTRKGQMRRARITLARGEAEPGRQPFADSRHRADAGADALTIVVNSVELAVLGSIARIAVELDSIVRLCHIGSFGRSCRRQRIDREVLFQCLDPLAKRFQLRSLIRADLGPNLETRQAYRRAKARYPPSTGHDQPRLVLLTSS